jgi:hypothetical protein
MTIVVFVVVDVDGWLNASEEDRKGRCSLVSLNDGMDVSCRDGARVAQCRSCVARLI